MRRLILAALLLTAACRPKKPTIVEDEAAPLAQTIEMGNPAHAKQLLEGFYPIEDNRWRWTAKRFVANVRPPLRAATAGAAVVFQFAYPEPIAAKLGTVTLRAKVAGHDLPTQTYSKPDSYTYTAPVPADWLKDETVKIELDLDKALPPAGAEHRELGLIATSLGLRPKS